MTKRLPFEVIFGLYSSSAYIWKIKRFTFEIKKIKKINLAFGKVWIYTTSFKIWRIELKSFLLKIKKVWKFTEEFFFHVSWSERSFWCTLILGSSAGGYKEFLRLRIIVGRENLKKPRRASKIWRTFTKKAMFLQFYLKI